MCGDFPSHLQMYSASPVFDQDSLPTALQRDHSTKPGVWGRIVVREGALIYLRDGRPAQLVTPGNPATIVPEEPHSVHPKGPVTLQVEFYRDPAEGDHE